MMLTPDARLHAISPIDGRYRQTLEPLSAYFSEGALIDYRVFVEIEYLIALSEIGLFSLKETEKKKLRKISSEFNASDAEQVKQIEKRTNHDVKAVEYFIKDAMHQAHLDKHSEWVHFGLTSQDVNNTAIPLLWKEAIEAIYLPALTDIIGLVEEAAHSWKNIPMLARTHGQPASPTKLGKELLVFTDRLTQQLKLFKAIPYAAKFGGATGNFNAHHVAFPKIKWKRFADQFVNKTLGLKRMQITTQIESYDHLAAQLDAMKRINTILIDFSRDIWMYISMEYFKQKVRADEVGSSAMPHKVNPIDFENAEGNLGIANALFEFMSAKLPVSRLQRDLTDSTVLRNLGVPFAHSYLAIHALRKGIQKLVVNREKINEDLKNNWAVVAEGIQTVLRREKYPQPYEALKTFTRGVSHLDEQAFITFIHGLDVSPSIRKELLAIRPETYTGED